ncbi:MAG: hypothetical protein WCG31_08075 [Deltaproteobacteria bacterium]
MIVPLTHLLILSTLIFTMGIFCLIAWRKNIIMMLIGGGGSIWGGLVGAVLMTWLSNSLSGTQQWSGVIYAAIIDVFSTTHPVPLCKPR